MMMMMMMMISIVMTNFVKRNWRFQSHCIMHLLTSIVVKFLKLQLLPIPRISYSDVFKSELILIHGIVGCMNKSAELIYMHFSNCRDNVARIQYL